MPGYPDSPDHIKFRFLRKSDFATEQFSSDLYRPDARPIWLELPQRNTGSDAVLIPLPEALSSKDLICLSDVTENLDAMIQIGADVIIVGFPFGIAHEELLPIWKRGIIASEPEIQFGGKSRFLIDATTRPGMSGSPVFAVIGSPYLSKSGNMTLSAGAGQHRLLGMYSAHLDVGKQIPELGVVWNKDVFPDFSCPNGTNPFPPV